MKTDKINLALIGAGNVMTTKHIPALKKNRNLFNIIGIVDIDEGKLKIIADKFGISNCALIENENFIEHIEWITKVDAFIVAIPPNKHFEVVKACLMLHKHVLVEKPFVCNIEQAKELVSLAKDLKLILAINFNIQYSKSFMSLERMIQKKELGEIKSIYCVQLTNQSRRIPRWTEDLPLGLFFDESPHYFYLIKKLIGENIKIISAHQSKSEKRTNTPEILNLNLEVNSMPVTIYWNFDSPICEWYFTVFGEKKSASVDIFRDTLIVLPNDSPHLGFEVLRTSLVATIQHWKGVIINGLFYLQNKLYYGFDLAQTNFYMAIVHNDTKNINGMSAKDALYVTEIQLKIVENLEKNG